ncbi:AGAP002588-PA [Anopheles gambiae str. PEST]|uniref:AGAP002588-PA n=1 Tax=Anopheles gambiae TaxID=7165 RepID=Q7QCE3_ANOGA|nr:uncharacterized protein LOC1273383 [Anopheles gambiae]EAA07694.2 AGAP002588-PA [Anopheles gambiae str. PEST]
MSRLQVLLVGVLLPIATLAAPTVHLQDYYPEAATTPGYDTVPSGTQTPPLQQPRAHVVEPTWITVTMPPVSYNPAGTDPKPHVMEPYVRYVPVAPLQQPPLVGQWPMPYPSMPVLPYPYHGNQWCNQPMGSYRP